MQVRLSADAQREYDEAVGHYLKHASENVAEQLTQDLLEAAGLVAAFPDGFPRLVNDIRRCPLTKFPYQLVYAVVGGGILIVAFMHYKRRPGYWAGRVKKAGKKS